MIALYCIFIHHTVKASVLVSSGPPALFIITCKFCLVVYLRGNNHKLKVKAVVLKF